MVVLDRFVQACGGPVARLVVLTTASSKPEVRVAEYRRAFGELGVEDVSFLHQDHRSQASDPVLLEALNRADGVFLAGGNQLRLVTLLGGTTVESLLRERYHRGLHLAGTSAGASAMSAVMIARGRARSAARLAAVHMSAGFALLPQVIVDQHFRERDRLGRLIAAVLLNPAMLGFGLDEDTAFELDQENRVNVFGSGSLTIIDGSQLEYSNIDIVPEESPVAFAGMHLHVLTEGWSYGLAERRVERPAAEPMASETVV